MFRNEERPHGGRSDEGRFPWAAAGYFGGLLRIACIAAAAAAAAAGAGVMLITTARVEFYDAVQKLNDQSTRKHAIVRAGDETFLLDEVTGRSRRLVKVEKDGREELVWMEIRTCRPEESGRLP